MLVPKVFSTLTFLTQPMSKEELFAQKSMLTMIMSSKQDLFLTSLSRALIVPRRSLQLEKLWVHPLVDNQYGVFSLATCWKQQLRSPFVDEIRDIIQCFLKLETQVSPNKNNVYQQELEETLTSHTQCTCQRSLRYVNALVDKLVAI